MSETTSQKVVNWARAQLGKQVRTGECWDLADSALKQAGAKSSGDLGPMDADADYVWGDEVTDLKDVQPGDILQFRDFTIATTVETETIYPDGSSDIATQEKEFTRPHHTAVVSEVKSGGMLKVLEQNVAPGGKKVQSNTLNTKDVPAGSSTSVKGKKQGDRHDDGNRQRDYLGLSSKEMI